jgi:beta-glucosidase
MPFPTDFAWGAATAAYQIEGAPLEDGKGPSIWDMFVQRPGKIFRGHTGEVACDHYHRWAEDVELMRRIGLTAYRMEICWPRVMPEGTGAPNEAGLAFYDRLIDALLAAGITPWVTLYHWSMPWAIHLRGGWANPDIAEWFADYTAVIMDRFSDRVRHWLTINEPQVHLSAGYMSGNHAPGLQLTLAETLQMGHHLLLAHGKAVQTIRARAKTPAKVGWAPVGSMQRPASEAPEDIQAARTTSFDVGAGSLWNCVWWFDPVLTGAYPQRGLEVYGADVPRIAPGDMEQIHQPIDFLGANIYTASTVRAGSDGTPEFVEPSPSTPINTYGWSITPDVLYWAGRFYHERYGLPVVITENGVPIVEMPLPDGSVPDPQRTEFIRLHLAGVQRAIDEGYPFEGYFYWSLMDNFEWQEGYKQRFGLIHVDYDTQQRTLKDSTNFYRKVIETRGAPVD